MRLIASRLIACSLAGLLASCGSNGGTVPSVPPANLPSIVTVSSAGAPGSSYRVGATGSWTAVPSTSPAQFTVPLGQTAFSIAYLCDGEQIVINALVTETTNVSTPCITGGIGPFLNATTEVGGTYDGAALHAINAEVVSTESELFANVSGGAVGSYDNLTTASGSGNTFALAVTDDNADVLGFKSLRNVATTGATATVNFPPLTSADAAITEPISVSGLTGQDNLVAVTYLPSGPPAFDSGLPIVSPGIQVSHFTPTAYSGVPPADWQTGDLYLELFGSLSMIGNNEYLTYHESSATATAPIVATMPTLSQIPVNPTDYSFPLTYNGLPASDVVRGFLASIYANTDGIAEVDISSPGWLAGHSSYAPPSLAGATGMVTMTPATIVLAGYITVGATYVPTFTTDYLSLLPPPGQSLDLYVSAYSPVIPGPTLTRRIKSALRLVQGDRVPVRILQP